jgi:hypothetical protein
MKKICTICKLNLPPFSLSVQAETKAISGVAYLDKGFYTSYTHSAVLAISQAARQKLFAVRMNSGVGSVPVTTCGVLGHTGRRLLGGVRCGQFKFFFASSF